MSIHKVEDGVYKIRWREGGRNRSLNVHGSHELATKIQRKKLSARDENRHLDVKKEVNFRMTALIDRYREQYGRKKKSWDREKSVLEDIRKEFGSRFVREIGRRRHQRVVSRSHRRKGPGPRYGRAALQCHASHDGEGHERLVQGYRDRP